MLQTAINLLQSGQFPQAEQICREVLASGNDNETAYLLLALSLQAQGRIDEALPVFTRLTLDHPQSYEHWNNLGNALRQTKQHAQADTVYQRALALAGPNAGVLLNLGLNALDATNQTQALTWLKQAFTLAPQDPEIRVYYASAAFECGDMMTSRRLAAELDQSSLDLDPMGLAEAAWLLYRVGSPAAGEALIEKSAARFPGNPTILVRQAVLYERSNRVGDAQRLVDTLLSNSADLSPSQREDLAIVESGLAGRGSDLDAARTMHDRLIAAAESADKLAPLYFSLAKICDRQGDRDQTMATLALAHAARMQTVRRNSPDLLKPGTVPFPLARLKLKPEQVATWPALDNLPSRAASPVFVIGFPRSGTTMLETMLDAHPELACMDEQPFLQDLIDRMIGSNLAYPDDLDKLSAGQCEAMRALYWKRVSECVSLEPGQRLVDKNPLNMLKLPLIQRLFPQAQIILALRHPCDVVLSNYMQNFFSPSFAVMSETLKSTARNYAEAMEFWLDQQAVLHPNVIELVYEDLVVDLDRHARRLVEFLGLPWDEGMVRFHEHALKRGFISTPSYAQVVEPVYSRSVDRWKAYATYFEPVLPIVRPYAERFGYSL